MLRLKIVLITLVMVMVTALCGVVMAANSLVTATVSAGIEVNAASPSITLNVGPNTINVPSAVTVDVNANSWSLKVVGQNSGYLHSSSANYNLGQVTPDNPLKLSVDTLSGKYSGSTVSLAASSASTLASGVAAGEFPIPVNFIQTVRGDEPAKSDYTMTLTYTGSL